MSDDKAKEHEDILEMVKTYAQLKAEGKRPRQRTDVKDERSQVWLTSKDHEAQQRRTQMLTNACMGSIALYMKQPIYFYQCLFDLENFAFKNAIELTKGNVSAAARLLAVNRTTILNRLQKLGLCADDFRDRVWNGGSHPKYRIPVLKTPAEEEAFLERKKVRIMERASRAARDAELRSATEILDKMVEVAGVEVVAAPEDGVEVECQETVPASESSGSSDS